MSNGNYTNNFALDFTINRNILWITGYIRNYVTINDIPSEIIVLVNQFYMTQIYHQFNELLLFEQIVRGLYDDNIDETNCIQQNTILSIMNGDNFIITKGKPFLFDKLTTISIASLQKVNIELKQCQILIICSTRERAQEIDHKITIIGKYLSVINKLCIGGTTMAQDIDELSNDTQIITCAAATIYQLIKRNALNMNFLKLVILQDADDLLQKGFKEQIDEIIQYLPSKNTLQIALFTSTLCAEIREFEDNYMDKSKTVHIDIKKTENIKTFQNMKQYYVAVEDEQYKLATLLDIFDSLFIIKCIIYCNAKEKILWLNEKLNQYDFTVTTKRNEFLNENISILVTSDNDLNDLNLSQVSLVINYDLAIDNKSYLIRNGSYHTKGIAINFICDHELPISKLEREMSAQMEELPIEIEQILKK